MRELATAARIREFLRRLAVLTREPATVYLTGGATAVLHGWRDSTIDIERGHDRDLADVAAMLERELIEADDIWAYFDAVRPRLHRYPALDAGAIERAIDAAVGRRGDRGSR